MNLWMIKGKALRLVKGNIVQIDAEAIVNAANKSLILGGGVAGAIRNAGGPSIQEECNKIGPIEVGEAVITGAGNLRAKYVIHAAGPVYGEGDEEDKLRQATLNSLTLAAKNEIKTLALPAISTGIFHFPLRRCSEIMIQTALDHLTENPLPEEVIFCLYDDKAFSVFEETLAQIRERKEPQ
jgi:O-acetyl-ADP-ribose deacetylase (regulator of RNase III)